jgi:hypothetical protein
MPADSVIQLANTYRQRADRWERDAARNRRRTGHRASELLAGYADSQAADWHALADLADAAAGFDSTTAGWDPEPGRFAAVLERVAQRLAVPDAG